VVLDEHGTGKKVLGHTDWSVKHFRYIGERVHVIYDWDSLALKREPEIVGAAAGGFPMTWFLDVALLPTQDEAYAFVREYEECRGRQFTAAERATMTAAMNTWLCYGARIQHSLNPQERDYPRDSPRWILATYGSRFLAFD
jgi:hypothetical protein